MRRLANLLWDYCVARDTYDNVRRVSEPEEDDEGTFSFILWSNGTEYKVTIEEA